MKAKSLRGFQKALEGPARVVLTEHYKDYISTYWRYRDKNGPQCPFCQGISKNLFVREVDRTKSAILKMLTSNDWSEYR